MTIQITSKLLGKLVVGSFLTTLVGGLVIEQIKTERNKKRKKDYEKGFKDAVKFTYKHCPDGPAKAQEFWDEIIEHAKTNKD